MNWNPNLSRYVISYVISCVITGVKLRGHHIYIPTSHFKHRGLSSGKMHLFIHSFIYSIDMCFLCDGPMMVSMIQKQWNEDSDLREKLPVWCRKHKANQTLRVQSAHKNRSVSKTVWEYIRTSGKLTRRCRKSSKIDDDLVHNINLPPSLLFLPLWDKR